MIWYEMRWDETRWCDVIWYDIISNDVIWYNNSPKIWGLIFIHKYVFDLGNLQIELLFLSHFAAVKKQKHLVLSSSVGTFVASILACNLSQSSFYFCNLFNYLNVLIICCTALNCTALHYTLLHWTSLFWTSLFWTSLLWSSLFWTLMILL